MINDDIELMMMMMMMMMMMIGEHAMPQKPAVASMTIEFQCLDEGLDDVFLAGNESQ